MRKAILAGLALCVSLAGFAQTDYSRYYQSLPKAMPVVQGPVIPNNRVSLADFGGVGDGLTMNTEAFAKAISALNKKGRTLRRAGRYLAHRTHLAQRQH